MADVEVGGILFSQEYEGKRDEGKRQKQERKISKDMTKYELAQEKRILDPSTDKTARKILKQMTGNSYTNAEWTNNKKSQKRYNKVMNKPFDLWYVQQGITQMVNSLNSISEGAWGWIKKALALMIGMAIFDPKGVILKSIIMWGVGLLQSLFNWIFKSGIVTQLLKNFFEVFFITFPEVIKFFVVNVLPVVGKGLVEMGQQIFKGSEMSKVGQLVGKFVEKIGELLQNEKFLGYLGGLIDMLPEIIMGMIIWKFVVAKILKAVLSVISMFITFKMFMSTFGFGKGAAGATKGVGKFARLMANIGKTTLMVWLKKLPGKLWTMVKTFLSNISWAIYKWIIKFMPSFLLKVFSVSLRVAFKFIPIIGWIWTALELMWHFGDWIEIVFEKIQGFWEWVDEALGKLPWWVNIFIWPLRLIVKYLVFAAQFNPVRLITKFVFFIRKQYDIFKAKGLSGFDNFMDFLGKEINKQIDNFLLWLRDSFRNFFTIIKQYSKASLMPGYSYEQAEQDVENLIKLKKLESLGLVKLTDVDIQRGTFKTGLKSAQTIGGLKDAGFDIKSDYLTKGDIGISESEGITKTSEQDAMIKAASLILMSNKEEAGRFQSYVRELQSKQYKNFEEMMLAWEKAEKERQGVTGKQLQKTADSIVNGLKPTPTPPFANMTADKLRDLSGRPLLNF